ncbi:MAG: FeoA family protein [Pseudomonadota bacterium]
MPLKAPFDFKDLHVASNSLPAVPAGSPISLSTLRKGAQGTVTIVREDGVALGDDAGGTIVMRLIELGFVPGEAFEIIAESLPGGDPIAVRIGGSCFALRRREAAAVMVSVITP